MSATLEKNGSFQAAFRGSSSARSFSVVMPKVWNCLPRSAYLSPSLLTLRCAVKADPSGVSGAIRYQPGGAPRCSTPQTECWTGLYGLTASSGMTILTSLGYYPPQALDIVVGGLAMHFPPNFCPSSPPSHFHCFCQRRGCWTVTSGRAISPRRASWNSPSQLA